MHPLRLLPGLVMLVLGLGLPMGALAVDGVVEINQVRAVGGGVTPSDTPGFPVTLDTSGSYRLTGDLDVGALGRGVEITVDHVTLDLNGFSIFCTPAVGTDPDLPCPDAGGLNPIGIDATDRLNVAVENGSVRGIGGHGIRAGNHCRVRNVRLFRNLFNGMELGNDCTVESVDASENGATGMLMGGASTVSNSVATDNSTGIAVGEGSTVTNSTARGNSVGFTTSWGTTFRGCTAFSNAAGIFILQSGTVTDSSARSNTSHGIQVGVGSTVTNSSTQSNGGSGIVAGSGSTLIGNTARDNTGVGLEMFAADVGYAQNVLTGNNGGTGNPQVNGGVQLGTNFCDTNTTCP
jgi:hypothetical protein